MITGTSFVPVLGMKLRRLMNCELTLHLPIMMRCCVTATPLCAVCESQLDHLHSAQRIQRRSPDIHSDTSHSSAIHPDTSYATTYSTSAYLTVAHILPLPMPPPPSLSPPIPLPPISSLPMPPRPISSPPIPQRLSRHTHRARSQSQHATPLTPLRLPAVAWAVPVTVQSESAPHCLCTRIVPCDSSCCRRHSGWRAWILGQTQTGSMVPDSLSDPMAR
jgi:hypothetical protein